MLPEPRPKKLLDQMRDTLQVRHYSIRTENAYVDWARRFTLRVFHHKRHPKDMGNPEIEASRSVTHLPPLARGGRWPPPPRPRP